MPPSGNPGVPDENVVILDVYIDAVPLEEGRHSLSEPLLPGSADFSVTGQIPADVTLEEATAEASLYIARSSVPMSWTTQIPIALDWTFSSSVSDVIQHVMNALDERGMLSVRNVIAVLLHMRDVYRQAGSEVKVE